MLSVGFDLVEIRRMRRCLGNPRFERRVFSEAERAERAAYADDRRAASYAAAFAAKEAFGKALGTGIRGFSLAEVEVLHDASGAPFLRLNGAARHIAEQKRLNFSVSLTHTENTAGAAVLAYSATAAESDF